MSWRDLLNDASSLHFVGNFTPRPLANRASCFAWGLARQRRNLTALFHCDPRGDTRTRSILQALRDAQRVQVDPFEDIAVTEQLVEAGKLLDIELVDHVVIGSQRFVSLKERLRW